MVYVVDIDGTICTKTDGDYENAKPFFDRINKVNSLYDSGHTIIYFTARGMRRTNDNPVKAYEVCFQQTHKQLTEWGVKFHRLVMGKPYADYYIDDKGINDENFFNKENNGTNNSI